MARLRAGRRGHTTLAWLIAGAWLASSSGARAASELPFTPEFTEQIDAAFFDAGRLSRSKVETYRDGLARRRNQAHAVFGSELWAQGRGRRSAGRRAARRKVVEVYDLVLGGEDHPGWLDELVAQTDPVAARTLAAEILEIDYALLVEGDQPFSQKLPEHLGSIGLFEWNVPASTEVRRADRESRNLVDPATGLFYEYEDLRRLIERGEDLSRLDPPSDGSFWRDRGVIAEIDVARSYYEGGHAIHHGLHYPFPSSGGVLRKIRKSQTKPKFEIEVEVDGRKRRYKLKVGGEIHAEPVTGALLSTLGFNADVVRHVKNFRMDLGDMSVDELRNEWRSYFEFQRLHLSYRFDDYFDVGEDERGAYVVTKEGSLTAKPREVTRVGPWPWGANGNEGRREVRALGILSAWLGNTDMKEAENNKLLLRDGPDGRPRLYHLHHDLGHAFGRVISEQIEAFPWTLAGSRPGRVHLNYKSTWNPTLRKLITWADARWMVRQIAQLRREQIEQAVSLGVWPEPVAKLLVEKLVARRNQLVEAFELLGESTPSGEIRLLPFDRGITTADGRVVEGELVDGAFEGSTKEFDNYWEEFIGPVWEAAKLAGVATFQKTIGMIPAVIFDSDSVGLPKYLVLDLLVTLKREVEANPRPTSEGDYYLTKDKLLLGLRVGGGLIGTGTTAFYRAWTLVQPSGTLREAHYAGDKILNVRLPHHIRKENLPEEYVLLRESYVDVRAGVITETLGGSVTPVGARASLARVRLSRDIVSRKNGRLRAYQDRSHHQNRDVEGFFNLVFVRIPFAFGEVDEGSLGGVIYDLPTETDADDAWAEMLGQLIRDGDFSGVEERVEGIPIESQFREARRWFRIPIFFGRAANSRFDAVKVSPPGRPVEQSHFQYRTGASGHWSFLDWGEDFRHVVQTSAIAKPKQDEVKPAIVSTYYKRDRDTSDAELGDAYLRFANGLRSRGGPLIDFTPELHSENGIWGDLEVKVRIGYSQKAVKRLRELDPEEYWKRLRGALGISESRLERYRGWLNVRGKLAQAKRLQVPARVRTPILRSQAMLRKLRRAQETDRSEEWMQHLADALSQASFRRGGWYDPSVLGVLHDLLGRKQVSIEALVMPPPWVENRLVGSVPLSGSTGRRSHELPRQLVEFGPRCTAAVWEMLETFPRFESDDLRWPKHLPAESGNACDGSLGGFTR